MNNLDRDDDRDPEVEEQSLLAPAALDSSRDACYQRIVHYILPRVVSRYR